MQALDGKLHGSHGLLMEGCMACISFAWKAAWLMQALDGRLHGSYGLVMQSSLVYASFISNAQWLA